MPNGATPLGANTIVCCCTVPVKTAHCTGDSTDYKSET